MNFLMKEGWQKRLSEVIEEDSRSMRALSVDAGLGVNFISQMFKDGKSPSGDNLLKILGQLSQSAIAYVFLGIRISKEELEMLETYSKISDEAQASFRSLLGTLPQTEETP